MKQQTRWVNVLLIVALLTTCPGNAVMAQTPMGAAFTYQGRLLDSSNAPVTGLCDMSFTLYDEESGGAQIGATQTITDVVMSDGYFLADLDFGVQAWNGDMRWLQVEATCPPGGSLTGFPRQVVRAVPYAMYALNAITSTVYVTETVYYTPSYHLQGWETITGTPGTYTPTAHTQDWTTITDAPDTYTPTAHLQGWNTITGTPSTYTPTAHTQAWSTITGSQLTLTNTTGPSTMTAGVAATTGIVTLNATGTASRFVIIPPMTFNAAIMATAVVNPLTTAAESWIGPSPTAGIYFKSGSVGIGTTEPNLPIDVENSSTSYTGIETTNTDVTERRWSILAASNSGTYAPTKGFGIRDITGGATRFVIDTAGNVGIGDLTPLTKLQVAGLIYSSNSESDATGFASWADNSSKYNFMGSGGYWGIRSSTAHSFNLDVYNGYFPIAAMTVLQSGSVGIGTTNPNNFILQTAGNIGPNTSNTYDLGSAENYWATIHYHTLTSHSLSVFSTTVTLQNGKEVSCMDALKRIKADPTKKIKGVQHMDYATIPSVALNTAPKIYRGWREVGKNGEDGADLDMMVSLILCAEKELDAKNVALENRMSDLEKRISDLEQKIK